MADFEIRNPDAETTYRQKGAIGIAMFNAAFPGCLTRGEASDWIERIKADSTEGTARPPSLRWLSAWPSMEHSRYG